MVLLQFLARRLGSISRFGFSVQEGTSPEQFLVMARTRENSWGARDLTILGVRLQSTEVLAVLLVLLTLLFVASLIWWKRCIAVRRQAEDILPGEFERCPEPEARARRGIAPTMLLLMVLPPLAGALGAVVATDFYLLDFPVRPVLLLLAATTPFLVALGVRHLGIALTRLADLQQAEHSERDFGSLPTARALALWTALAMAFPIVFSWTEPHLQLLFDQEPIPISTGSSPRTPDASTEPDGASDREGVDLSGSPQPSPDDDSSGIGTEMPERDVSEPEVRENESAEDAISSARLQSSEAGLEEMLIRARIEAWARAWSREDVDDYLSFYDETFTPPDGSSLDEWSARRRDRMQGSGAIEISIEDLSIEVDEHEAGVRFWQEYRSAQFADRVDKTMQLSKESGAWRIVSEETVQTEAVSAADDLSENPTSAPPPPQRPDPSETPVGPPLETPEVDSSSLEPDIAGLEIAPAEPQAPLPPLSEGPAEPAEPLPLDNFSPIESVLRRWREAQDNSNLEAYLGFYSSSFEPEGGETRESWLSRCEDRFSRPSLLTGELLGLQIQIQLDSENASAREASATFHRAVTRHVEGEEEVGSSRFLLTLRREPDGWKILRETALTE